MDPSPECSREVRIVNQQGFHARPIMQFVNLASQYDATIEVTKGDQCVDGKSPMEIMLLEAVFGTSLILTARGADAEQALDALAGLIASRFEEH